jgi:hypothetical protein
VAKSAAPGREQKRERARAGASARYIARRATVDLEADDPMAVADGVSGLARSAGGYVEARRESRERAMTITIRVPADRFDSVVSSVRSLATVRDVSTSAEDLGPKLAELDAKESAGERRADTALADSSAAVTRQRAELLNRTRLATVTVVIAPRPRTQSSAATAAAGPPAAMATAAARSERIREALGRGMSHAAELLFLAVLVALERGPSAVVVGAAVYAGFRFLSGRKTVRRVGVRATSPLA